MNEPAGSRRSLTADPPVGGPGVWAFADRQIRALDVSPAMVDLLSELSLSGGESAWTKPALVSFYQDEGDAATAELFFSELKELTLAVRAVTVEKRYAPWSGTTAISDLPATTMTRDHGVVGPPVWLARWVGVTQRLSSTWEKVHPFLLDLADETPVVVDDDEPRVDGGTPLGGLPSFVKMLEALVEPAPASDEVRAAPVGPWDAASASYLHSLVLRVPEGPVEWALRGRRLSFPDGMRLEFLRFPRLGQVSWGDGSSRFMFTLGETGQTWPVGWSAVLGSYLSESEPTLASVATGFAERCHRAARRMRSTFAAELVERALIAPNEERGAG